jgi:hypothetical protein
MGITALNINMSFGFSTFCGVVAVVGNVAGPIFDEVVVRIESGPANSLSGGCQNSSFSDAGMSSQSL